MILPEGEEKDDWGKCWACSGDEKVEIDRSLGQQ